MIGRRRKPTVGSNHGGRKKNGALAFVQEASKASQANAGAKLLASSLVFSLSLMNLFLLNFFWIVL
jgi:hypothetical protein